MTQDEMRRYKQPTPYHNPVASLLDLSEDLREDEHGIYDTGLYEYKGKSILICKEKEGKWHLSVSANHTLGYYELKEIRYKFMPDAMHVAQIFPPRDEFINLHENCFHLWEMRDEEMIR